MSYKITQMKTKAVQQFRIDIATLRKYFVGYWPDYADLMEMDANSIRFFRGPSIEGEVTDDEIDVSKFRITGEWSDVVWREVVLPAFAESKGSAEIVIVWEGGEIERIRIDDGTITTQIG